MVEEEKKMDTVSASELGCRSLEMDKQSWKMKLLDIWIIALFVGKPVPWFNIHIQKRKDHFWPFVMMMQRKETNNIMHREGSYKQQREGKQVIARTDRQTDRQIKEKMEKESGKNLHFVSLRSISLSFFFLWDCKVFPSDWPHEESLLNSWGGCRSLSPWKYQF